MNDTLNTGEPERDAAQETGPIKMVIESWKRQGMSHGAYLDYLKVQHGDMVRVHGPRLGFTRYVQDLRTVQAQELDAFAARRGWATPPDGSVALWFENGAAMSRAFASPEGRAASAILKEDELKFIDPGRISAFMAKEHVVFDDREGAETGLPNVKLVMQVWRGSDVTPSQFKQRWHADHAALVNELRSDLGIVRYVQSRRIASKEIAAYARDRGWRAAPDGLMEFWWAGQSDMANAWASQAGRDAWRRLAELEGSFLDEARTKAFLAMEHLVYSSNSTPAREGESA